MHILVREQHGLDETAQAVDLGHAPADLVFLSFSDSDLAALAAAWRTLPEPRPSLRLANLGQLSHPMSVDLYAENTITRARCVAARMVGGLDFWRYGAEQLAAACRAHGVKLALLPGDGRSDPRLAQLSTLDADACARLDDYLREGGPANSRAALLFAQALLGDGAAPPPPIPSPAFGEHEFRTAATPANAPVAALILYRAHLMAGDIAPHAALAAALATRCVRTRALYAPSLKEPEAAAFVSTALKAWKPRIVLNATGFSARKGEAASPLDAANAPVLQLVLSSAAKPAWEGAARGLSPSDLAMQIVLPELDGRLASTAISFKEQDEYSNELQFARTYHAPDPAQIALAADQALGWIKLGANPRSKRKIAIVLSDYPAIGGQIGHAIGLDTFASAQAIAEALAGAGYTAPPAPIAEALRDAPQIGRLKLADYQRLFARLPLPARTAIEAAWGSPADDPHLTDEGFAFHGASAGKLLFTIQPDRGARLDRKSLYHDPTTPPRHAYVAFYLWLRDHARFDALVHLGAHGTLEWLPGKAAAPAEACIPSALTRGLPIIYPFIVNNPGEAAPAKRRLGAVLIGHLTPPLREAGLAGQAQQLERLIDEYASADGLDARRAKALRRDIIDAAHDCGLLSESGASADGDDTETLARLDAYLCDVKEMQIRDGLHIFGRTPAKAQMQELARTLQAAAPDDLDLQDRLNQSPRAEMAALIAALDARFIPPGPAGAPTRGRSDVLPTGRNLTTIDPRTMPTPAAMRAAEKAAAALLRRHAQDEGEPLRALVIDAWGGPNMRTGGEDIALAFVLMGVKPIWHHGSARVTGIDVTPPPLMNRPRVDVTLRISGLFRDAFAEQIVLFDLAVRTLARRNEPVEDNPLAAARALDAQAFRKATARVFGGAPGDYGAARLIDSIAAGAWEKRGDLGAAYLEASAYAYGQDLDGVRDADSLKARIAGAGALFHGQDNAELDILDSYDFAAHEGGFAAAAETLGARARIYHADTSRPDGARVRTAAEEVTRTIRARAANPRWIAGMQRHAYRGAAEIARSVETLFAFAATLPDRFDGQFELLFDATLANADVAAFMHRENPAAHQAMRARFREAVRRDLWRPKRNDLDPCLADAAAPAITDAVSVEHRAGAIIVQYRGAPGPVQQHPPRARYLLDLVARAMRRANPVSYACGRGVSEAAFASTDEAAASALAETLRGHLAKWCAKPVEPSHVEDILAITGKERTRWGKDGRLPRSGTGQFRNGKQTIQYFTHPVDAIERLAARPEIISAWRASDAEGKTNG